ncbi:MAG: hypothetical protein HYT28_02660 [Parcubacteria group bacterium]|nr:hypothetical protein [Parcubacteria group bacterium]
MKHSWIKNSIVIVGIVLLLAVGYNTFLKPNASVSPNQVLVSETPNGESPQAQSGREILTLLLNLKSLKLDTAIFSNRAFQNLADFGQSIPERPRGRDNPFAPIETANVSKTVF